MMDIRRAAALLLALVMIAALTVGCGKKQSDTPTDTPAAGADVRTPDQQPAKLVCYNGSVTLRFVREEDTWYWGDDRDFPLEQSIVTELLATVQGYAALSPLPHTDDLSQFGLSDTKRYISLTDTEGNTRTYWLGTQTDEGQYIQPEGETDAVYLSPAGVDGTLSMGIYDMARLPQLPQLTADNVSALTVTAADGKSLSLTASEGVWLRSGQDVTQWSGKLTEALGQLTLLRCIDYRPSTGVAELCGLTEPTVTLTVTYRAIAGETELTLRVGAQRDGGYYATVNDDDTIYLLPAAPAEVLAALAANGLNG